MDLDKSIGTGAGIIGSLLVASPKLAIFGFGIWAIGNTAWVHAGWKSNDKYLVVLFSFYFLTVVLSVITRIGGD